jgi:hypothetical protein
MHRGGADKNREADQTEWLCLFTDVLLLELSSQVALDEGGLSGTAITDYVGEGGEEGNVVTLVSMDPQQVSRAEQTRAT